MITLKFNDIGIDMIKDNRERVSTMSCPPSYLVWAFSKDITEEEPLIISREENEVFYSNLEWFMNQSYVFEGDNSKYNKKTDDEFVWLSDSMDLFGLDETPRLSIKKMGDNFIISYNNPYFEKNNISRGVVIAFSPLGNGQYAKNIETKTNLQDDFIMMYKATLENKKINKEKEKTR